MRSHDAQPSDGEDRPPQPRQIPDVATPTYAKAVSDGWIIEAMMQIQLSIGELKASVAQSKTVSDTHQATTSADFRRTMSGIAAATVLLAGALVAGYFRLEDKQSDLDTKITRIETKLDDVLQRMPVALLAPGVSTRR